MGTLVEKASKGDVQAVKVCEEIAWRQEKQMEKSQISPYSLEEVLERSWLQHEKYAELMTPTWLKERAKRLGHPDGDGQAKEMVIETKPEPDLAPPVAANMCEACGQTRCAHGRWSVCDICRDCD